MWLRVLKSSEHCVLIELGIAHAAPHRQEGVESRAPTPFSHVILQPRSRDHFEERMMRGGWEDDGRESDAMREGR
eukprot:1780709-Rhodomonas_salina.1